MSGFTHATSSGNNKAIMFLGRSEEPNYRKIINKEEIYIKLMSQTYLPKQKDKREKALKLVDRLLKEVNIYEINVNMNEESAKMTKERIIDDETK